jgi:hypothetical protein
MSSSVHARTRVCAWRVRVGVCMSSSVHARTRVCACERVCSCVCARGAYAAYACVRLLSYVQLKTNRRQQLRRVRVC